MEYCVGYSVCDSLVGECFLDTRRCVFERNIYGGPVHCGDTGHLRYCQHYQCPGRWCNWFSRFNMLRRFDPFSTSLRAGRRELQPDDIVYFVSTRYSPQ